MPNRSRHSDIPPARVRFLLADIRVGLPDLRSRGKEEAKSRVLSVVSAWNTLLCSAYRVGASILSPRPKASIIPRWILMLLFAEGASSDDP